MKKKIVALSLVICMLAIAIVGGTLAYFTDNEEQTNTFTAGKVEIKLDETEVSKDDKGNLVSTGIRTEDDQGDYKLFPAMTVDKDPTITVDSESEDAYIAAKVIITGNKTDEKNLHSLIGMDGYDYIDINGLVTGGLMGKTVTHDTDWNGLPVVFKTEDCVIYQDADKTNEIWTLYIFMEGAKQADDVIALFTKMNIPADWDNAEMAQINSMTIKVEAYAVQANGFTNCYDAMTAAFTKTDGTGAFDPVK